MEWLIFGIVIGLGAWGLSAWTSARKIRLLWYDWALAVLAVAFALLAYQNYTASIAELEPQAATFLLVAFGVPALILAGVAVFLVWRRHQPAKAAPQKA
ncbi:MAG: hypothetical protein L0Y55_15645 [Anaerolineales bacterium]|nr:hypothetical protein [Anaerolineales bacterium]